MNLEKTVIITIGSRVNHGDPAKETIAGTVNVSGRPGWQAEIETVKEKLTGTAEWLTLSIQEKICRLKSALAREQYIFVQIRPVEIVFFP